MTPLTPGAKSMVGRVAAMAKSAGKPLLPWQDHYVRGRTEIDPETGTLRYSRTVTSTPRQVGKTTTDGFTSMANVLHLGPNRRAWYTAQDGTKAREVFREFMDTIEKTPYRPALAKLLRGNGAELIQTVRGGQYRPFVPNHESLHSKQADTVTLDEVWTYTTLQGQAIIQAADAPMSSRLEITGHEPQMNIMSTEGTAESEWFNPLLDELRAEPDPHTFFVDFGLREDEDPTDLELVAKRHPGYGHLFNMNSLRKRFAAYKGDTEGFARAYGNRRTGAVSRVIPQQIWSEGRTHEQIPEGVPVCVAAAVGVDDADAAITMTGYHPQYGKITEIVQGGHRAGSAWALLRLKELQANAGKAVPVAIDERGPSAHLHDQARRAGIPLLEGTTQTAYAAACPGVLAGLETGEWRYRPHEALDLASDLAARRWIQDGAWVWGRRASVGSIAALEAATWSSWGIDHLPEEETPQIFL
ncbi:MAG: hypothetical protein ACTJF6_08800 [Microbacteriaceae bacterium]